MPTSPCISPVTTSRWRCDPSRDPKDAGEALLSFAAERGCDLLVMGAYAHSRMRELVLGGATRTIFEEMTLPVLMAH